MILAALGLASPLVVSALLQQPAAQQPAAAAAEDFYQDFRGTQKPRDPLQLIGEDAEDVAKPEEAA